MEKCTKNMFMEKSSKEKLEYLKKVLELKPEDLTVFAEIIKNENGIFAIPYNAQGELTAIFSRGFRAIKLSFASVKSLERREIEILPSDLIKGELKIYDDNLLLDVQQKFLSYAEFKQEILETLREKLDNKGLQEEDIIDLQKGTYISIWVADLIQALIEKKYKPLLEKKEMQHKDRIEQQKREVDLLTKQINELQKDYEIKSKKFEMELKKEENKLTYMKQKNVKAKKKHAYYEELGCIPEILEDTSVNGKEYSYTYYKELIHAIYRLAAKKEFYYKESTIRQFMNALRTKQLIILWGKPGSGKTSLPKLVCELINAEFVRIQVQSNWTDNQDLLGFYNIVNKRYVSTQFMDTLVKAKENPKRFYLVLLDEMNLSNIEYYFSEMLNVFTWEEEYKIHLYSERERSNIQRAIENAKKNKEDVTELCLILRDMNTYVPEFSIPDNIRFVGTLNSDSTTKIISPKVIDRSYLIELRSYQGQNSDMEDESRELSEEEFIVPVNYFAVKKSDYHLEEKENFFDEIKSILDKMNLNFSNRIKLYIQQFYGWDDATITEDDIVLGKVLPYIDLEDNENNRKVLRELLVFLQENHCLQSAEKLKEILSKSGAWSRIMYWEN